MTFVSVVVPTYNRKEDLRKTIGALANQSYPKDKYEIIICDDTSTDGTQEMVLRFKEKYQNIVYLHSDINRGDGFARNLGLMRSTGDIIAFTDDDCIPSNDWIEKGVKYFEIDVGLTGLQGRTIPEEKIRLKNKIFHYARTLHISKQDINCQTCNMFYRKKDLLEIGGFDPEIRYVNDVDISARLLEKNKKIIFSDKVLVQHKVEYMRFFDYLSRMSVNQYYPLLVKKNPSIRNRLFLKIFGKKSHIYVIFIFFSIILFLLGNLNPFFNPLGYTTLVISLVTYFFSRVAKDNKVAQYPIRMLFFVRYLLLDGFDVLFLVKGSLKYRCLVL